MDDERRWYRPRRAAALAVVLGVLMVVVPLVLTLPQKAADADDLNANLKPVSMLGQSFPATAAALANLPTAMPRFQSLVGTFDDNLGNDDTLKPVSFAPIIWTLMAAGLLTVLAAGAVLVRPRHTIVPLRV